MCESVASWMVAARYQDSEKGVLWEYGPTAQEAVDTWVLRHGAMLRREEVHTCPCEGEDDNPGQHLPTCRFADPGCDKGGRSDV